VGHAVKRLLLAGGGTGGHLYPAMAVGEAWRARFGDEAELLFVGTAERIEATAVPAAGERLATIEVTGIVGLRGWRRVLGLARMPLALWQALRIVRQFEPDAVLGAGGFASGPTVLAAWLLRKPTAILEQNAMPGVTNRILGKLVRRVFTCFARAESWFAVGKVRRLGNPVRASQTEALASAVRTVREDDTSVRILVMGGSGGARALNEGAPAALAALSPPARARILVVHQAGPRNNLAPIEAMYRQADVRAEVLPYLDDMAERYRWADLAICRAGATTVTELAIAGLASLLVPFPLATHDHQRHNAAELVEAGAAVLVSEVGLAQVLPETLEALISDRSRLAAMGEAARSVAKPDAAHHVVDELVAISGIEA
jgi:UDP-N-acetylglucosamine--N-acetylmuramyl-(pentapeptide) pyrophosphoryl-undecaprenol N-acetylglucosamine transferase